MKCIECGHELKDGAVFCIRCGAMQVSSDDKASTANNSTVRPSVSNNQGGRHTAGKSFKPTPRRSTASVVVPIVAAVAVLGAVAALGMFVLNPGASSSSSSAQTSSAQAAASSSESSASSSASSSSASSSSASSTASSSKSSAASGTSTTTNAGSSTSASRTGTATGTTTQQNTGTNQNNTTTQQQQQQQQQAQQQQQQQAQQQQEQEQQAAEPAGDNSYYLGDTSSRYYSLDEINSMSDYDLYYARNEIFARHGRMFRNSDLQEYFNSKSWYDPTYTPEQWDSMASPLSDIEQTNADLMYQVEESRNSPYL